MVPLIKHKSVCLVFHHEFCYISVLLDQLEGFEFVSGPLSEKFLLPSFVEAHAQLSERQDGLDLPFFRIQFSHKLTLVHILHST